MAGRADQAQGLGVFAADESARSASQTRPGGHQGHVVGGGLTTVSASSCPPPDLAIAQTSSI